MASIGKHCKNCSADFEVTEEDIKFYDKVSPVFDSRKFQVPVPTLCPDCRQQRRLVFRNERKLYHRKCDFSGKEIIAMYAPDVPYKVYDQDVWWSDKWDPLQYGRDFDFSKTFSEQLRALYLDVPHISLYTNNVENSYYTNFVINQKNCYLIFGGGSNEDCMFGNFISFSNTCLDLMSVFNCELCYEGGVSSNCYNCKFFLYVRNCSDCIMIEDCQSCKNCIGCFGLRNKEYCVFNESVGKEQFEAIKKEYEYLTDEKIKVLSTKLTELKKKVPHIGSHIYNSEDCTGDMIINCKRCEYSFSVRDCENCKYASYSPKSISSYDCTFNSPDGVQFCYNVCSTVGTRNSMATFLIWYCDEIFYSTECHNSSNLFGCVGLKSQKYCILNKQYSQEEYGKMAAKIAAHMMKTGEWGDYFPYEISPYSYNETIANEHFPLDRQQAGEIGMSWKKDDEKGKYQGAAVIVSSDIRNVTDDITRQILTCRQCGKNYKIIQQELNFYRKMKIPVPKNCFDCRYKNRLALENPHKLWDRTCMKCGAAIKTAYSPERPEVVYCESCYLKEVY